MIASSRSSARSNRDGCRRSHAQNAEQLVRRKQRQRDAAAHHELRSSDGRDAWRQILDDNSRPRGDHLIARP